LVAGQIAITALLLVVAALLTRSLIAAQNAKLGLPVDRLALVSLDTGMVNYSDAKSRTFFDEALTRIRAIPGVDAAALTTRLPFSPNWNRWNILIDGQHRPDDRGDTVEVTTLSPDYFKIITILILQGRAIADG